MMPLTRKIVAKNPMKISSDAATAPVPRLSMAVACCRNPSWLDSMFRFMLGRTERRGGALEVILLAADADEHLQREVVHATSIAGSPTDAHDRDLRAL